MSAISLVLLVFNAWLAVLLCNAEKEATIASTRVDAEQDPFQSVTVDVSDVGPASVLFGSCLAASLTMSAKFYSIVAGVNNIEYVRYVPDSTMTEHVTVQWLTLNVAGSILDCADAASDAGYPMFTYDGTACLVDDNSYDTAVTPACDDNKTNAVFINPAAMLFCKYPTLRVKDGPCLTVYNTPSYTIADVATICGSVGLYDNLGDDFDLVVAALKLNGYTSTKLLVDSSTDSDANFISWTNASYFATASDVSSLLSSAYMDPDSNFLLKVDTTNTVHYGLLCYA